MSTLPIIRGTSTALYPYTQTFIAHTGKLDAQNGATARWVQAPPTLRFELPFMPMKRSERDTLKSAFGTAKGQFDTTLQFTADQTYTNLSLEVDEFASVEQTSTKYGARLMLSQSLPQNFSPGASGGLYPVLSNGALGQLPYTQKKRWQTITSVLANGIKYSYAEFAAGLSSFPTDGLMAWELDEHALTDTEVTSKINHWLANWGDCFAFTFKDEDGTTYSNVHYATPQLTIVRQRPNLSSIHTTLIQTA